MGGIVKNRGQNYLSYDPSLDTSNLHSLSQMTPQNQYWTGWGGVEQNEWNRMNRGGYGGYGGQAPQYGGYGSYGMPSAGASYPSQLGQMGTALFNSRQGGMWNDYLDRADDWDILATLAGSNSWMPSYGAPKQQPGPQGYPQMAQSYAPNMPDWGMDRSAMRQPMKSPWSMQNASQYAYPY